MLDVFLCLPFFRRLIPVLNSNHQIVHRNNLAPYSRALETARYSVTRHLQRHDGYQQLLASGNLER